MGGEDMGQEEMDEGDDDEDEYGSQYD